MVLSPKTCFRRILNICECSHTQGCHTYAHFEFQHDVGISNCQTMMGIREKEEETQLNISELW